MVAQNPNPTGRKLPTRQVCARYGVTDRTISRWERDPDLNFPQPAIINNRKYYNEDQLTDWDRANAGRREVASLLWSEGLIDLQPAVDELQAAAEKSGLVQDLGQDAVQAIMSQAFRQWRHEC